MRRPFSRQPPQAVIQLDPAVSPRTTVPPARSAVPASGSVAHATDTIVDDVPYALRISASWAWRLGLIIVVAGMLVWLLGAISLLIIPLMVAGLLAGLLTPATNLMRRHRVPNGLAVAVTVLIFLALIVGGLSLVGSQLAMGFADLRDEAIQGIQKIQDWLSTGPLHLTNEQIDSYIQDLGNAAQNNSSTIVSGALSFGSTAGHLAAGTALAVFALIFFLLEGGRIWMFLIGLMPQKARVPMDGAGRRGWLSMVHYVRMQVFVAFVDAVGIGAGAAFIGVPLVLPLSVLVFMGSFIPIVGALFTGFIAVLLALVANGGVSALVMLAIVLIVQQIEGHILQPLVMGKAVALHPLAVVLAVAGGSLLAGIPGALFSVPLLAIVNTMVRYISSRAWETDPVVGAPALAGASAGGNVGRAAEESMSVKDIDPDDSMVPVKGTDPAAEPARDNPEQEDPARDNPEQENAEQEDPAQENRARKGTEREDGP